MEELSVESLLILIFGVLPGFVSSAIRSTLEPGEAVEVGQWIARSIVAGLVYNAVVLAAFVFGGSSLSIHGSIGEISESLKDIKVSVGLWYIADLYIVAIFWGIASAFARDYAPRVLAHSLRLTPIGPDHTVLRAALKDLFRTRRNKKLSNRPEQLVPWIRLSRPRSIVVIGRLQRTSAVFSVDEPTEIFLSPAFVFRHDKLPTRAESKPDMQRQKGIYMRLVPKDVVEILSARKDWHPSREEILAEHVRLD